MGIYIYIHMYVCMYVWMYACMHACPCMYVCMYLDIDIYIYTAENLKDWDNGQTRILAAAKE